jgi:hypothetical protein
MTLRVIALSIVLWQNSLPPQALWGWPTVAQAWTAPNGESTIDSGYRMFTTPDMGDICARAPSPARLVAKGRVMLRVGQWFNFSSLRITAVDAAGRTLQPVPVDLDVEEVYPPLFSLSNDVIGYGGVTPTRAGRFKFRARTIYLGTSAEVFVPAVVRQRYSSGPLTHSA